MYTNSTSSHSFSDSQLMFTRARTFAAHVKTHTKICVRYKHTSRFKNNIPLTFATPKDVLNYSPYFALNSESNNRSFMPDNRSFMVNEKIEHVRIYGSGNNITILTCADNKFEPIKSWHAKGYKNNEKSISIPDKNLEHLRIYRGLDDTKICLPYVNEKLNGSFETWHSNGLNKELGTYVDGVLNGEYKKWNDQGILIDSYNFHNGEFNGPYKIYYDSGIPQRETTYVNDKLDGIDRHWHPNGTLKLECTHKNAILNGEYQTWHFNGIPHSKFCLVNGTINGNYKHWDFYGNERTVCNFVNGIVDGEITYWDVIAQNYAVADASNSDYYVDYQIHRFLHPE